MEVFQGYIVLIQDGKYFLLQPYMNSWISLLTTSGYLTYNLYAVRWVVFPITNVLETPISFESSHFIQY